MEKALEVKAELLERNLWNRFAKLTNEMIIARPGRRMFPIPEFHLTGLEPTAPYICEIRAITADLYRYRYDSSADSWIASDATDAISQHHSRVHPTGAALGDVWMKTGVRFDRLRLSNVESKENDLLTLSSHRKYKMQLMVTKLSIPCQKWLFDFPEMEFITVTGYKKAKIVNLKIAHNPFAKAFKAGAGTKRALSKSDKSDPKSESAAKKSRVTSRQPCVTSAQLHMTSTQPRVTSSQTPQISGKLLSNNYSISGSTRTPSPGSAQSLPQSMERNTSELQASNQIPYQTPAPKAPQEHGFLSASGILPVETTDLCGVQDTANQIASPEPANQGLSSYTRYNAPVAREVITNQNTFWSPAKQQLSSRMIQWSPLAVNYEDSSTNHCSPWQITEPASFCNLAWNPATNFDMCDFNSPSPIPFQPFGHNQNIHGHSLGNSSYYDSPSGMFGQYNGYDVMTPGLCGLYDGYDVMTGWLPYCDSLQMRDH